MMPENDLSKADLTFNNNSRHRDSNDLPDGAASLYAEALLQLPQSSSDVFNLGPMSTAESWMPPLKISDRNDVPDKIDKPGDYSETMMIDGMARHCHLHVPPNYNPSRPMPLVVVLHGHGDDADGIARISGMNAEADEEGFIVAYPEAVHWFGAKQMAAWDTDNGLLPPSTHVDDGGFLRKVIDTSQSQLSVDQKRIYMVGFSNGGMETYKAVGELSDKLAAVVDVSGAMSGAEAKPASPVSVLSIVGTSDKVVPPEGRSREEEAAAAAPDVMRQLSKVFPGLGDSPVASKTLQALAIKIGFVPEFKPVTFATDFFKSADGISGAGVTRQDGAITTQTYTNPLNGVTVEQEVIAGADHMVQHGTPSGFNLADTTWEFLEAHPKVS
jgi:polyhydroxybutyrate depolymerase